MLSKRNCLRVGAFLALGCPSTPPPTPTPTPSPAPDTGQSPTYRLYVANEPSAHASRIAFTPGIGARKERNVSVGIMPAAIDGPHALTVSPAGRAWYV